MAILPKPRTRDAIKDIFDAIRGSRKRQEVVKPQSVGGYGGSGGSGAGSGSAGATTIVVKEADGSPNVTDVDTIVVPNGGLTDDGSGQVTLGYALSSVTNYWDRTGTVLSPVNAGDTVELAQTSTTGNSLKVSRNLTSTSTDAPVARILQDHASDDQDALSIQQDGVGDGVDVTATNSTGVAVRATQSHASAATIAVLGQVSSSHNEAYGGSFDQIKLGNYFDVTEGTAPATPASTAWRLYAKTDGLYYKQDDGTEYGPLNYSPWTDGGTVVYATNNENVAIGGTTIAGADIALNADGSAVFNEQSSDVDFRVESNGNENMLFVDGGADAVGIGINPPTSTGHISGSFATAYNSLAANTTLGATHCVIEVDGTLVGGPVTLTLPAASGCAGRHYWIKNTDRNSTTNTVTVARSGSDTINSVAANDTIAVKGVRHYVSDGTSDWNNHE